MTDLPSLEAKEDLEELVFHLKGILDAVEVVRLQIALLDKTIDCDLGQATDALGRLRAELYTHVPYHLKELRRPFLKLSNSLSHEMEKAASAAVMDPEPEIEDSTS